MKTNHKTGRDPLTILSHEHFGSDDSIWWLVFAAAMVVSSAVALLFG